MQRGQQETPLYDILHYEDARRQPLAPGDRVLAPWEPSAKRFGPGTVLRVVENTEAPLGTFLSSAGLTSGAGHCVGKRTGSGTENSPPAAWVLFIVFLLLALSHFFGVTFNTAHRICLCFVLWVKTS